MDVAEGDTMKMGSEVNNHIWKAKRNTCSTERIINSFLPGTGVPITSMCCVEHGKEEMDKFMKAFPY
jgi:hypothetical protein